MPRASDRHVAHGQPHTTYAKGRRERESKREREFGRKCFSNYHMGPQVSCLAPYAVSVSVYLPACLSPRLSANRTKCCQWSNCQSQDDGACDAIGALSASALNILYTNARTHSHIYASAHSPTSECAHKCPYEHGASLCHYHIHQLCKQLCEQSSNTHMQTHAHIFPITHTF